VVTRKISYITSPDPDYTPRELLPLAPSSIDATQLPAPLRDGERPLSAEEARETYLLIERDTWNTDGHTSKHMRHLKELYPRILETDRQLQQQYEGLTTAKLTRGLSPRDESGNRLTLWELDEMLNDRDVRERVHSSLRYHLKERGEFEFEWVAVTSVTRIRGTPREYIYLWIDDPDDEVSVDHLSPALEKHLDGCENARREDHKYQQDGSAGAITIEHSPALVSDPPKKFFQIQKESETSGQPNTTGASFVAQQLVHLPVGDYANSQHKNPPDTLLEGAALAWASPNKWFRASKGVYG